MDGMRGSSVLAWLAGRVQSVGDFIFFRTILQYLRHEVQDLGIAMLARLMQWVGGLALTLMILWIMLQGWRIVTGRSRESMMLLVMNSLRATLILTIATGMSMFGTRLHSFLLTDVKSEIHWAVTGSHSSPEAAIDKSLAWMQVALTSIDALDVAGDPTIDSAKSRALWFTGLGTGGPALMGGMMLLLYEVALALFIGLGPLFILSLLFDQTRPLFSKWLYYGIGTMFSMAVLSAMVSIALDMVVRVSAAFWSTALLGRFIGTNFNDGITSQAMQQGGMGVILTGLIVSAPPMAAMFFNGTLGYFSPQSGSTAAGRAAGGAYPTAIQQAYGKAAPLSAPSTASGAALSSATSPWYPNGTNAINSAASGRRGLASQPMPRPGAGGESKGE